MKVLIADDQSIYRETLKAILRPYGTFVEVEDGALAVEAFQAALQAGEPFKLVLLDIQMPHMDGQEALLRIRQMEKQAYGASLDIRPYAFIVMQTSMEDPIQLVQAFKKGHCNGYIQKPVQKAELLEKLRKHGLIG
ncbi:MAG: response regulator [Magnetococcales bacterium]|nr:response regulator [Magnetococcales bacterium]